MKLSTPTIIFLILSVPFWGIALYAPLQDGLVSLLQLDHITAKTLFRRISLPIYAIICLVLLVRSVFHGDDWGNLQTHAREAEIKRHQAQEASAIGNTASVHMLAQQAQHAVKNALQLACQLGSKRAADLAKQALNDGFAATHAINTAYTVRAGNYPGIAAMQALEGATAALAELKGVSDNLEKSLAEANTQLAEANTRIAEASAHQASTELQQAQARIAELEALLQLSPKGKHGRC